MSNENDSAVIVEQSARGGYYLFVGNTLATVILVVSSIVIAKLLGPEDYGLFSLVLVIPALFIGLIDFGINSAITKFVAEFRSEGRISDAKLVIKSGLYLVLTLGVIASVLCFIFSDALSTYIINTPEASGYIKIASIIILIQTLFNTLGAIFIGLDSMENNAFMMVIRAVTKVLLSTFLIILGFSILGALVGHIICYVVAVSLCLTILTFKLRKKTDDNKSSSRILKSMLKYGAPIYLSCLVTLFITQYQTIILAFFASKIVVGNFQVSALFSTAIGFMVYPFTALFPAFSKFSHKSEQLSRFFMRSVKYTALLLVPGSVAIALMSKDLIYAFYGSEYTLASTFVAFYVLVHLYAGFGSAVFGFLFNGIGRTDVTFKSSLVSLISFIPLAPLFISLYGILGLIVAFLMSNFLSLIYYLLIAVKQIKLQIDIRSSVKIYFDTAISAIVLFIFVTASPFNGIPNLILGGMLFFFTYLTLLPVIGILNLTDIKILRQLFRNTKSLWPIVKLLLVYETKVLNFKQKLTR